MKKFIFLTVLFAGAASFAQSSSAPTPVESSTTSTSAVGAAGKSRWGGTAALMAATDVKAQQDKGHNALIGVDNYLGINYALNPKLKLEVGYNFSFSNVVDPGASYQNTSMGRDPEITLKQTGGKIGNSDPITAWYSYYVPMGSYSQQVKGGNGTLRNDVFTNFNLPHKWSLMPWISTRAYLGNSANNVNEALYRFNWGGAVTYNFSDVFNAYYWPQTDIRTTGLNRGKMTYNGAGEMNMFQHEIGLNYTVKINGSEWTLNPAFVNHQDLSSGQGFGRTYYAENGSPEPINTADIDFNIWGSF